VAIAPSGLMHQYNRADGGLVGGSQIAFQPPVLCRSPATTVTSWQLVTVDI
jgi:hypothetical protein